MNVFDEQFLKAVEESQWLSEESHILASKASKAIAGSSMANSSAPNSTPNNLTGGEAEQEEPGPKYGANIRSTLSRRNKAGRFSHAFKPKGAYLCS